MSRTAPPASAEAAAALRLEAVSRVFQTGSRTVTALDSVDLTLVRGTFTAIMGPSGSGKTTLLQCASGLDRPTSGRVFIGGQPMPAGSEAAVTKFRRGRVGFVFQHYNLMPALTVKQNVTLPAKLAGRRISADRRDAVLAQVGLADRGDHRPAQLSGGEQQRVAIARALVTSPEILFADEPTGALDSRSAQTVLRLLDQAVRTHGQTVVLVTHDPVAAAHADTVLFLMDGRLVDRLPGPTAVAVADRMTRLADEVDRRAAEAEV
ncbi:MAG: ABC transporter ATP-binding protein [Catenulispora sp.]|nr:ABC transporter ATP-binding protein [Catenulispora sp.]